MSDTLDGLTNLLRETLGTTLMSILLNRSLQLSLEILSVPYGQTQKRKLLRCSCLMQLKTTAEEKSLIMCLRDVNLEKLKVHTLDLNSGQTGQVVRSSTSVVLNLEGLLPLNLSLPLHLSQWDLRFKQ